MTGDGGTLGPNPDGTPWVARAMRITTTRIISQSFFFGLFIFLLWTTWFSRLGGYPVSLFLELDPLVAFATALSTHTVYRWLWRGLWVLAATLLLGRVFCSWVCPFGALHHFLGWVLNIRPNRDNLAANRYRPLYQLKYYVLAVSLVMAAFGALQIGLLDPICLFARSIIVALAPASDLAATHLGDYLDQQGFDPALVSFLSSAPQAPAQRVFTGAWFVGLLVVVLLGMNLIIPRFFCRSLCPLGAFLGLLSRWSFWRIDRDLDKCTDCDLCLRHCEGASDPQSALRKSECLVCFNCVDNCPENALSFRFMPVPQLAGPQPDAEPASAPHPSPLSKRPDTEILAPAVPNRRWFLACTAGVLGYPLLRLSNAVNARGFSEQAIRPPGSVAEGEFLERCVKCAQCINICPTNVLQPSGLAEAGFEGLWTPVMDFSVGFCQLNCTLCSEVCPTGAIQKTTLERKLGLGSYKDAGPLRIGTAFINRGRCLPWAMETPCVVCQEVCPISPKAVGTYQETIMRWDKREVTLDKPYIRPELCTGCGICQRECPVLDRAAVEVTPIGETRSAERSLLLRRRGIEK